MIRQTIQEELLKRLKEKCRFLPVLAGLRQGKTYASDGARLI
jgi:hypothetical protein